MNKNFYCLAILAIIYLPLHAEPYDDLKNAILESDTEKIYTLLFTISFAKDKDVQRINFERKPEIPLSIFQKEHLISLLHAQYKLGKRLPYSTENILIFAKICEVRKVLQEHLHLTYNN